MQTCPACGGPLADWLMVGSSEPLLSGQRFELRRCQVCGSAVTAGDALGELHETGAYAPGTPRLHRLAQPILGAFDRQRLALITPHRPAPARLLDVGAGRGRFVVAAARAGYAASGIEPSARGVAAARAIGAEVEQAGIEDAQLARASVDAVTLWHVLEHLDRPAPALETITRWLRPGATLLIGVPNLASVQARLGVRCWYHLDVPRHRVHFTPAGLTALVRSAGFTPVATHHLLLEHNPFGMWQSLANRLTRHPSYLYNLLKRNAPARSRDLPVTLAALALLPLTSVAEAIAASVGRGGTIAMVARWDGSAR